MRFEKHTLCDMDHCYAVAAADIDGRPHYLFAAENDNPCYAFDMVTLSRSTVWEHPGGTMSMVPIPGRSGFLAVQNFRSGFMAQDTTLVWARPQNGGWHVQTLLKHPFIHRFDILESNGIDYLLVCTLATAKKDKDDWSSPGKLWAGVLPKDPGKTVCLKAIHEGLLKNHGYCRVQWNGKVAGMSASAAGVLVSTPPETPGGTWTTEKILDRAVSEAVIADIDGDGEVELATIEPFHGDTFIINKKIRGQWEVVYRYESGFDFGHVAWGGMLRGKPAFIGGARRGLKELFLIRWDGSRFIHTVIDQGGGPSNIAVFNAPDKDIIAAANREQAQAVLYYVND